MAQKPPSHGHSNARPSDISRRTETPPAMTESFASSSAPQTTNDPRQNTVIQADALGLVGKLILMTQDDTTCTEKPGAVQLVLSAGRNTDGGTGIMYAAVNSPPTPRAREYYLSTLKEAIGLDENHPAYPKIHFSISSQKEDNVCRLVVPTSSIPPYLNGINHIRFGPLSLLGTDRNNISRYLSQPVLPDKLLILVGSDSLMMDSPIKDFFRHVAAVIDPNEEIVMRCGGQDMWSDLFQEKFGRDVMSMGVPAFKQEDLSFTDIGKPGFYMN